MTQKVLLRKYGLKAMTKAKKYLGLKGGTSGYVKPEKEQQTKGA